MPPEEICIACDEPTGRAGVGEDSLSVTFLDGSVHEPLCEACFDRYEKVRIELTRGSVL